MKALALFVLVFLHPDQAQADSVAYSCENKAAPHATPIMEFGACVGFQTADGRKVDFGTRTSGELLASPDGRTVVMLQSFPYASMQADGTVASHGSAKPVDNPAVVLVYRDGRRLAHHRIDGLLVRPYLLEMSVSHVMWLQESRVDKKKNALFLRTTSFRDVYIDLETGKVTADDSPAWKGCQVIAYGAVHGDASGHRMEPAFVAKGPRTKRLRFTGPAPVTRQGAYETLCFEGGPGGLRMTKKLDLMLNGLTF